MMSTETTDKPACTGTETNHIEVTDGLQLEASPSTSSCRWTSFLSSRTQTLFHSLFLSLGRLIYDYHFRFLAAGLAITLLSAIAGGSYWFLICTASDGVCTANKSYDLWTPRDSIIWSQYVGMVEMFGSYPSGMSLLLTANNEHNSMLTPSALNTAYEIFNAVEDMAVGNDLSASYDYLDICLRSVPSHEDCDSTINGVFNVLFQDNPVLWSEESTVRQIVNTPDAPVGFFLGGFELDDVGAIQRATSMHLFYELVGAFTKHQ